MTKQKYSTIERRVQTAAQRISLLRKSGGGILTKDQVDKIFKYLQAELDAAKKDILSTPTVNRFTL